ncbi:putative transposon Tn552 DNA-invertase bin3 [compost metagenome]
MFVRAYLRVSTKEQDASRAKQQLEDFALENGLKIAAFYAENESGASLQRPVLFELIKEAHPGDILLVEQVNRLSRLKDSDWLSLKKSLNEKNIKVIALDLPTSWMMSRSDEFTESMFAALNNMMMDMLAAVARKDYLTRRNRAAQGVEKAKKANKYKGRTENKERNLLIRKHLTAGLSSWTEIGQLIGCSRGTIAKQAAILKSQIPAS